MDEIRDGFSSLMQEKVTQMWADKLGLDTFDAPLFNSLLTLMMKTHVDYTMFFRELCNIPEDVSGIAKSFYAEPDESLANEWHQWLTSWRESLNVAKGIEVIRREMRQVNPKYTWREWLVVPAYEQARLGDFGLIHELQTILADPYGEQSKEVEEKYYRLRPLEYFSAGGVSHYSCSS